MHIVLALLISFGCIADAKKPQDPCAKSKSSTDAFTGQQVRSYSALRWSLETTGGESTWSVKVGSQGAVDAALAPGWTLSIALDGGDSLDLKTAESVPAVMNATSYGVTTQWTPRFKLTPEQVRLFAGTPINAFRVTVKGAAQTWETDDGFKKNMAEAFGCAVTLLP
jgi:hypothetical protein